MGNCVVSNVAQRVAGTRVRQQGAATITRDVADGDHRVGKGQHVGDNGSNHNHNRIEGVKHSDNDHPGFPAAMGRLERPVNRR